MISIHSSNARQYAVFLLLSLAHSSTAFNLPPGRASINSQVRQVTKVVPLSYQLDESDNKQFFETVPINGSFIANGDSSATLKVPKVVPEAPVEKIKEETTTDKTEKAPIVLSNTKAILFGMVLSLCSGFVNGSCLSGFWSTCQATSAVTGSWTNSALQAAQHSGAFLISAKYILSYIAGSTIGGLLVPNPVPFQINNPKGVTMGLGSSSLLLVAAAFLGSAAGVGCNTNILSLCLMATSIQNSLSSVLTSNLCRTAHMSGISSDIGTFLGQFLRGNKDNMLKLKAFPLLGLSFWLGGFASFSLTRQFASKSLLIAASVYGALAALLSVKVAQRK